MDKKTLLFVLFSLGLTACGGGSSNSNIVGSDADQRITVTSEGIREDVALSLYVNGTPTEETVISRDGQFAFEYLVSDGDIFVVNIEEPFPFDTECELFNNGPATVGSAPLDIRLSCEQLASVRGTIYLQTAFQTDADINDINTNTANNNFFERAQEIRNDLPLQGFVSRYSFDADQGNYSNFPDRIDFFKVELEAGQIVELEGTAYQDRDDSDVDLELYSDTFELVGRSSKLGGEIDQISIQQDNTYYIVVEAVKGASKYLLSFGQMAESSQILGSTKNVIPNQAIVRQKIDKTTRTSAASIASSLSHFNYNRAALATFDLSEQKAQIASASSSADLELDLYLEQNQPESYAKRQTLKKIKELSLRSEIANAQPNFRVQLSAVPDDFYYTNQWHYPQINLEQAWDSETGLGSDVIVSVIDTGVWLAHEDLVGKFVAGYDFIDDPVSSLDGDGRDNDPNDPGDQNNNDGSSSWHGTHVAGTIAANTNNVTGVSGISWGAKIMPIRAFGKLGGHTYDIIQAILFSAGLPNDSGTVPERRADIINMSFGIYGFWQEEANAIKAAYDAGVILVAAAGNEEETAPLYPASYPEVISVSATNKDNELADYSNYGSYIDIAAPGGDISVIPENGVLSTYVEETQFYGNNSSYAYAEGTSMASPHVAGIIALMKSAYPELSPDDVFRLMRAGKLTSGTRNSSSFGNGIIDAEKAIRAAQALANPPVIENPDPELALNTYNIALNNETLLTDIILSNLGGETSITSISNNDTDWLNIFEKNIDDDGFGIYTVSANIDGLEDGVYRATVTFTEDQGSTIDLGITLTVISRSIINTEYSSPVHVRLYNSRLEFVEQTVVAEDATMGVYSFEFDNIPPGTYTLTAGSDIDNNFSLCEFAETCGAYPLLNDKSEIVIGDNDVDGLAFDIFLVEQQEDQ